MLNTLFPIIVLVALVAVPLVWRIRADRQRDSADALRADIRNAVNRRLHGESLLAVEVVPKDPLASRTDRSENARGLRGPDRRGMA